MTTGEAAAWLRTAVGALAAAGVDSPRLDAELLLAHCLGVERSRLWTRMAADLSSEQRTCLDVDLQRRVAREPLAYIVGERWFYGLDFAVTPSVLTPRPETEQLVEAALAWLSQRSEQQCTVIDVGTGSGAIAVALAANATNADPLLATDLSLAALAVAESNARKHGVWDRIHFVQGDLLEVLSEPVDLVVANLPYVAETDRASLMPEVRDYEPDIALFGGPDGLQAIASLLAQAPLHMAPRGALLLEIGWNQGPSALALARQALPAASSRVEPDLAGHDRLLAIQL